MSDTLQCQQCQSPIPKNALFGLCQKCLFAIATDPDSASQTRVQQKGTRPERRFADYELGRQIGRGGMGVVYEAIQVSLHRRVALKMILEAHIDSPSVRRRFTIEAEAAAKLDHPNIVPIYEVGELDGQPFLSMKFIEGESLKDMIHHGRLCVAPRTGPLPKNEVKSRELLVAHLISAVAQAVHHAHEQGVLHRDLKPANILVDAQGRPHLTDFGLAKLLNQLPATTHANPLTIEGTAMGTPSYMSPEQAAGSQVTVASDVYSLGAVLYEMLTGQPPFKAATALETLRMVTDQQARRPSSMLRLIDPDIETICLKCLDKNPRARYPSALALAEDLDRWTRNEPIHARPVGPIRRAMSWSARNKVGAGLIASLCLGLTLALTLLHLTNQQRRRLDLMRAEHLQKVTLGVEELWLDPTKTYAPILSSDLKALANLVPRDPGAHVERLTFAVRINQAPVAQAIVYAPLLHHIEGKMEAILHRPVVFDLRLYKMSMGPSQPVVRNETDFQRMGSLAYIRAKEAAPGIQAVLRELLDREAVIFARKPLGISTLSQVKGHRVAFAHTNSTLSFLAKVHLARAGVTASQLSLYTNLAYVDPMYIGSAKDNPSSRPEGEMDAEGLAHKAVVRAVLRGDYDVGEIQARYFENYRYKRGELLELASFQVPSDVHVASAGLSPIIVKAFQEAMTSLKSSQEKKMLARLQTSVIQGFQIATDRDYDEMRSMIRNEWLQFETGVAPSSQTRR
ncbi:MAG: protein kinase [Verrucomicrobia bacterium]|nr:protein kinase [Verrucomicrobiota bacterium]